MGSDAAGVVPEDFEEESGEPTPRVLAVLTSVLERLVARNDWIGADSPESAGKGPMQAFRAARVPRISIGKYLERIYRYTQCSPSCFVVGFVYIDRMVHRHPGAVLASVNVHRLILTSLMVASKVLDDVHYNNGFYARVGGVSNAELNRLELELLFLLDFGVTVSSRVFESYCLHLEKEVMFREAGEKIARVGRHFVAGEVERASNGDQPRHSIG